MTENMGIMVRVNSVIKDEKGNIIAVRGHEMIEGENTESVHGTRNGFVTGKNLMQILFIVHMHFGSKTRKMKTGNQ